MLTDFLRKAEGEQRGQLVFNFDGTPADYVNVHNDYLEFLRRTLVLLCENPMYVLRVEAQKPESPGFDNELLVTMMAIPFEGDFERAEVKPDNTADGLYFEASVRYDDTPYAYIANFLRSQSRRLRGLALEDRLSQSAEEPIRDQVVVDFDDARNSIYVMHDPLTIPDKLLDKIFGYDEDLIQFLEKNTHYRVEINIEYWRDETESRDHYYFVTFKLRKPPQMRAPQTLFFRAKNRIIEVDEKHLHGEKPFYVQSYLESEFPNQESVRDHIKRKIDYLVLLSQGRVDYGRFIGV